MFIEVTIKKGYRQLRLEAYVAYTTRDAAVQLGPVQRSFYPNSELDLGPVWALRLNPKPCWGLVWVIFLPKPWTGPQSRN
jgi:hypothetical protein